jgi:hypothetical protein
MYGYYGLASAMEFSMSYHFNEAAKACRSPGIALKVTGTTQDPFSTGTRALIQVTYPDQSVGTISPSLYDLEPLANILPAEAVENREVLSVFARHAIQQHDEELARQRQEAWDDSALGKAVAWVGRHFHL